MSDEEMKQEKSDEPLDRRKLLGLMAGAAVGIPLLSAADAMAASKDSKDEEEKGEGDGGKAAAGAAAATSSLIEPGEYTLPPLPYAKNALDSYLSAEILELHHDVHHAGYVRGLNGALADMAEAREKGDFSSIKALERALAFHGSGHALHTLYWNSMSPNGGGEPEGALKSAIEASFGSVDGFRKQFAAATKAAEASAWGVLAYEPLGKRLVIIAAEDHQNMGFQGAYPLLCCDVWEHAYYLRYKSNRASYVDRFFDVINWSHAQKELERLSR